MTLRLLRLAVVSDLHLTLAATTRAAWHNAFDFAGLPSRVDAARVIAQRARVDAVVACGDITHAGDEPSARAALERLYTNLGRPLLVIPGNHDCLERDDQLERCLPDGCELLTASGADLAGVHLAGVAIERDAEARRHRWTGASDIAGDERVSVVASHFPVLSRARRLAELGLRYPSGLINRAALHDRLLCARPVIVLSGHIHARDSHADGNVLQLSAAALVEAPYEVAIVEVRVTRDEVRVRRRLHALGPPATHHNPVLAPGDEAWRFCAGAWRLAPPAVESAA